MNMHCINENYRSFGLFKRLSKQTPDRALHMLASYVFDFDK